MARRRKKKGSGGGWLLLVIALGAAGAAYYFWPQLRRHVDLAKWTTAPTNQVPTNRSERPDRPIASQPATPDPSPAPALPGSPLTNLPVEPKNDRKTVTPEPPPKREPRNLRPVRNVLDAQIALARLGISVGPIDGAAGSNMQRALLAWQIHNGIGVSGELDAETKDALKVEDPLYLDYTVTEQDLKRLMKIPPTWLGKSEVDRLDYESILELVAERGRSSPEFIRRLNPSINWTNLTAGTLIKIPRIDPPPVREKAAFVRVHLYSKTLNVFGARTNLLAHFPCSIAAKVEKRPVGTLQVAKVAANPNYLFDPEVFSESPEARKINRKLVIPPGPNNPVGTAWIGLDKPGYGIHGTPKPEQVGRTESHGCFRLANWNAEHLLQLVWIGLPVIVEP